MKKLYLMTMAIIFAGSCTNYIESNVPTATYTFKNMSNYSMSIRVDGTYKDQAYRFTLKAGESKSQSLQKRMIEADIIVGKVYEDDPFARENKDKYTILKMSNYNPFDSTLDIKQPYVLRWNGGVSGGLFSEIINPSKLSTYVIILRYDAANGFSTALMPKAKFDSKDGNITQADIDTSATDITNDSNIRWIFNK